MGGPAFTDPSERSICGNGYTPARPTATPVLVAMSRMTRSSSVGLQFVNANAAVDPLDVRAQPSDSSTASVYTIARDVGFGQLAPRTPRNDRSAQSLGTTTDTAGLELFEEGNTSPMFERPWSEVLAPTEIQSMKDGRAYTLVFIGPRPGFQRQRWWNGALLTIVDNDPIR
jgi:hypothetical protein